MHPVSTGEQLEALFAVRLLTSEFPPLPLRPSETFLSQLEVFGAAKYRVSNKDKVTREFYRDRVVTEVLSESRCPSLPG